MSVYTLRTGDSPLIVSVPHAGTDVPPDLKPRFSKAARSLPDTDWYVDRLYDFLDRLSATVLIATQSRYVVDLNRASDGQALYPGQSETTLCPTTTFAGEPIYKAGDEPDADEIDARIGTWWRPYHERLATEIHRVRERHGHAVVWDAHSIPGVVPRFFDGRLPDLNLGTWSGRSCAAGLATRVASLGECAKYTFVRDGRFKGGYITRHYGDPARGVHALQMEIAQASYMRETPPVAFDEKLAAELRPVLHDMLKICVDYSLQG